MILAGAGGHGLEVYDILSAQGNAEQLEVFDQNVKKLLFMDRYSVIHQAELLKSTKFCLGIGNVDARKYLYELLKGLGKSHYPLRAANSVISRFAQLDQVDVFHFCFIGSKAQLGIGCLVNTGAQVHHEAKVGDFTVINPGAILLGAAQVGEFCSIGTNATILPQVKLGNRVTVGAGAVVTKDVPDGVTVVGVPARVV